MAIDEKGVAITNFNDIKQRVDQDLNSFVSDITLFVNRALYSDKDSDQVQTSEAFLQGYIHQSDTNLVFKVDTQP